MIRKMTCVTCLAGAMLLAAQTAGTEDLQHPRGGLRRPRPGRGRRNGGPASVFGAGFRCHPEIRR